MASALTKDGLRRRTAVTIDVAISTVALAEESETSRRKERMRRSRTGSKQLIREMNQALVLGTLRSSGTASRTEIVKATGLSPATVSGITGQLIEYGLLHETATGKSVGGRKPVLLELVAAAGFVLGAKVTETEVIAVLTDLDATVVARSRGNLRHQGVDHVVAVIAEVARLLVPAAGGRPVHGLGVGLAGIIDSANGVVCHATYNDWRDVPLASLLEAELDLPVTVDNDVNALVSIEKWFGAGRDTSNLLLISVGRGVGLGMILDGKLYRGASGGAGEFGHVKVRSPGEPCGCGGSGCLESEVGNLAIARDISRRLGRRVEPSEALDLARLGVPEALEVYAAAANSLGVATANLVNVLNPELIVVTGEGVGAANLFRDTFELSLASHCFDGLRDHLEVVIEDWDEESWARGAASLLLSEMFEPALRPEGYRRPALIP